MRHYLSEAIERLDDIAAGDALRPHALLEILDDELGILAHDTFISVLALGQLLRHPTEDDDTIKRSTIELAERSVWALLDELTPFVSRADDGLRRVPGAASSSELGARRFQTSTSTSSPGS